MGRWRASLVLKHIFTNRNPISNTNPYHKYINCSTPINKFLHFRPFSALPYPRPIYNDEEYEFNNKTHEDDDDFDQTNCIFPHKDGEIIPVKAYFLCTSIDLKGMQTENSRFYVPPTSRSSNYIALRFTPPQVNGIKYEMNASTYQYMVVFDYGSTVLFNVEDHEIEYYLQSVRKHATGLLPEMKKDDYVVKEKPLLEEDMQGGSDHIVLKNVDIDSIRIIGSVLGQSIALDYFVSQVDGMVQEFADINREMEKLGTFTMDRKKLFKLVGKANSNLADLILKVGIFERSEIAWRDAKYAQILEYLREEYEVTQRFGNLNFKRKFVEHNIHFLQEVLQNRKSDLLEWCIIILLSIENVIGLYEIVQDSSGVS